LKNAVDIGDILIMAFVALVLISGAVVVFKFMKRKN
jgi:hypothetical protein